MFSSPDITSAKLPMIKVLAKMIEKIISPVAKIKRMDLDERSNP